MTKIAALVGWPLTAVYFTLWVMAAIYCVQVFFATRKHRHWRAANAKVIVNKLVSAERQSDNGTPMIVHSAKVRYAYQVNNVAYESNMEKLAKRLENGQKIHEALLKQYPVGSQLGIHYDPADPSKTTTEKGISLPQILIGLVLMLAIMGLSVLILDAV